MQRKNIVKKDIPCLKIQSLRFSNKVNDISFDLSRGEILGIAGLLGSGKTELAKCIFGLEKPDSGQILMDGKNITVGKPWQSIKTGIMLVPENRRKDGIVDIHTVKANMTMSILQRLRKNLFIDEKKSTSLVSKFIEQLSLKCTSMEQEVMFLSGGNQQKVVFGKSLLTQPKVLILDEPTVGIDIEAKESIAHLIREIADEGSSIILISSETEELERLCDRVLIFHKGKIVRTLDRYLADEITEFSLSQAIQLL